VNEEQSETKAEGQAPQKNKQIVIKTDWERRRILEARVKKQGKS